MAMGCSDHSVRMFTFSDGGCPISAGRLSAHEVCISIAVGLMKIFMELNFAILHRLFFPPF